MKPHFKDTTSNIKMSDTWKIQLSTAIKYFHLKILMNSVKSLQIEIT